MYKIIAEGGASLHVPVEGTFGKRVSGKDKKPPVFYNPHMALNRDLTVLFMKTAGPGLVFADVLSGSGAKGIRVAVEAGNPVFLNDANEEAVELIKRNVGLNKVEASISNMDANTFLHENKGSFDFIDIDPFGSPVPFLDSALLSLKKTGFLGVTATDTATLCGVYKSTCLRRYQALPLRSDICHEVGLRILIGYLARTAAKHDKGVQPALSHSTRHYFRLYVAVNKGVKHAKHSLESMGYLHYCRKCRGFTYERETLPSKRLCSCSSKTAVSGPLWLGPLHDPAVVKEMHHEAVGSAEKLLKTILEEAEFPFYYDTHTLAKDLRVTVKDMETIIAELRKKGFQASRTHFTPTAIKTDAPIDEVKKSLT